MSQQPLDLRRSVGIIRRHKILIGVVVALGILGGAGYAIHKPPMYTSTALVLIANGPSGQTGQSAQSAATGGSTDYMATQVVIADSDPVLTRALPGISPAVSLAELQLEVQVTGVTSNVVSVTAKSKSAAGAESAVNAVAKSYVSYAGTAKTPTGHVPAQVLQSATTATASSRLTTLITDLLIGAAAGALVGILLALALGRRDSRLTTRDAIADSIGVPVLASLPVGHPADAAGWARLLKEYQPAPVHAWRLRKALQQLGLFGNAQGNGRDSGSSSVAVLSLSGDPGALALGPQLAVYAASLGIRTVLFVGPQQDENVTATLRVACAAVESAPSERSNRLRVLASAGDLAGRQSNSALTVVVAVVDGSTPRMPDMMRTTTTVLGVSAGVATAEQLARVAVSAAEDGFEIVGVLVADPDPTDNTTGQIPYLTHPTRRRMPRRLSGRITEITR